MRKALSILFVIFCLSMIAFAAKSTRPHIGYVYPAGGCTGTEVEVVIGGQRLRQVSGGIISGDGVTVEEISPFRPFQNINNIRRQLRYFIKQSDKGIFEPEILKPADPETWKAKGILGKGKSATTKIPKSSELKDKPLKSRQYLSDEEIIKVLKELTPLQLALLVRETLVYRNKLQQSPAIAEFVIAKIKIDANAKPGVRELRLITPQGITGGLKFVVGRVPEYKSLPMTQKDRNPVTVAGSLPAVFNGQIMPGEVDRWRFKAKAGSNLTLSLMGRSLVPYMGDAVPGWFQPVISICDTSGKELAYADDNLFDPDPVLNFKVPEDGTYELRVRDSIYRGREDFTYRVKVNNAETILKKNDFFEFPCSVGVGRVIKEKEPNNLPPSAMPVKFPVNIRGKIEKSGELDFYSFSTRKGHEIVIEIFARRCGSPLDSLIRVIDHSGKILAWNDDAPAANIGLETHHADSFLKFKAPEDGKYYILVTDAQNHGGSKYFYQIKIGQPEPDFALYIQPSAIEVRAGTSTAIKVTATRHDGFDGPINVRLISAPKWLKLTGGVIPAGQNSAWMVLTATDRKINKYIKPIVLAGSAKIRSGFVKHNVIPTDEMMQAFIYLHLVPAQELLLSIQRRGWTPARLNKQKKIVFNPGKPAVLSVFAREKLNNNRHIEFDIVSPEKGIKLERMAFDGKYCKLFFSSDPGILPPGTTGSLILECFVCGKNKRGKEFRNSTGVLPAVPFTIDDK